jgi:type IV secretion system protein VirD4
MAAKPDGFRDRIVTVLLVGDLVYAAAAATQWVAWRFQFDPHLGRAAFAANLTQARLLAAGAIAAVLVGSLLLLAPTIRRIVPALWLAAVASVVAARMPVYHPWALVKWAYLYRHWPPMVGAVRRAVYVFGGAALAAIVGTVGMLPSAAARRRRPTASHGSAHWGSGSSLRAGEGLILGVDQKRRYLRYAGDGHVVTVAPTRTGKGVGCVIPNLLTYPGPVVVSDPKGENYAVTGGARRAMGGPVHALDPFDIAGGLAAFNPMDLVDATSGLAHDDAWLLADMLVAGQGRAPSDAYWDEEARALLAGLVLYVAACEPVVQRTLGRVRALLTAAPATFAGLIATMQGSSAFGGLVARAANRIDQKEPRERAHVISAAQSHTHFLDSPAMGRVMGESTVSLEELATTSLYIILPADRMDTYRAWQRLVIACALRSATGRPGRRPHRTLVLLDEFANLGRMRPIERGVTIAAGYGVTFWLLVQDVAQLRSVYGEAAQTFLANADVLQAFGVNDYDTAEHLSRLAGESTILVTSDNYSSGVTHGRGGSSQEGAGETIAERGRRLITADEVRRMGAHEQLLFARGEAPLRVGRPDYRADKSMLAQASENPLHAEGPSGLHRTALPSTEGG